jgi:hypothetical protein
MKQIARILAFTVLLSSPALAATTEGYAWEDGSEVQFKSVASGAVKITARWKKAPVIDVPHKVESEGQNVIALAVCTIDEAGMLSACKIGRENPPMLGWGAAVIHGLEGSQIDPESPDQPFMTGQIVLPATVSFHNTVSISSTNTGGEISSEAKPLDW